jgi:hypothetical protein
MKKSIVVTIIVDNVELKDLDELTEAIQTLFEDYENKRINISLQDETLVARP